MARTTTRTQPVFLTPMAAHTVKTLPEGEEWQYELKFDGYRALILKNGPRIAIRSRNDKDLTRMYPRVVEAARRMHAEQAVIDGEIVAIDEHGRPSFQALQHRGSHPKHEIVFYAFDVLHLNGRDLTRQALTARRARLPTILEGTGIKTSQTLPGRAADVVAAVHAIGLEGVIAKRKGSIYQPGERSTDWVKLKLERQQEFVIGGYRPEGENSFDALLVGYYEGRDLRFAGKVRAGFVPHVRRELLGKLKPLQVARCPFTNLPDATTGRWGGGVTADQMSQIQWTRPKLVSQILFVEWTAEGRLRHAAFLGLRTDQAAKNVRREP